MQMPEAVLPPVHPGRLDFGSKPNPGTNGGDLFYGHCYSPFTPSPKHPSPRSTLLASSSPSSSGSGVDDGLVATEHRLYLTRPAIQYQEVTNRFQLCLAHLADATTEAEALRLENAELRAANNAMAARIVMLGGQQGSAIALVDHLRQLNLAGVQTMPQATPTLALQPQATPMLVPQPQATPMLVPQPQATLPKSISIRSTGYLKTVHSGGKHRVSKPVDVGSHRVFVGMDGAKPEEKKGGGDKDRVTSGLEFEVYSQGMYKTELCNKWEETGECPYSDQCQFAHGIAELRPIIRHPRYKTQVCRMVLGGYLCPYGHRCHFRHSMTPAGGGHLLCP